MSSTPLPALVPSRVQHRGGIVSAYNVILRLEKAILADIDSTAEESKRRDAERSLMYCRIIGHFFHHVPSENGVSQLVHDVSSAKENKQQLLDLGKLYYNHALRVFRSAKGRTPAQSNHPSRPSFGNVADLVKAKLEEAPQGHKTAKDRALIRDGFRCLISGVYDTSSTKESAELKREARGNIAWTQCAHIFSESTNPGVSEGSSKSDYAASAWTLLSRFGGFKDLADELNGARVHRLENVMTMELNVHHYFDNFDLWLEPTRVENEYNVKASDPDILSKYPPVVKFTTPDPVNLPLPSREYLELHAACAKVAHLSAAAEYLDSIFRDMEELLVLSKDGSSAAVLEHAIWAAQGKLIST